MVPPNLVDKWEQDLDAFSALYLDQVVLVNRGQADTRQLRQPGALRYGVARHSVEFLKLLDDKPRDRCHIVLLAQGAMSRAQTDIWVRLALIRETLRRHGRRVRLNKVKKQIHRFLGELLHAKGQQRATDVERELNTVLILQLLSRHIGDEIDGVVTGLATFGLFVQSRKFGIEALIRMAELGDDQWKFNPKTQSIVALRSGCSVRLGQPMKVRITSVNVPARQLNAVPAEPLTLEPPAKSKSKTLKKSRNRSTQKRSRAKR